VRRYIGSATIPPVRHRVLLAVLLLLAAALLAHGASLGNGFVWDDDDYVTQNPVLRTAGGIFRIWFEPTSLPQYYPLVHSTFWLEYRLWGPSPLSYHLVNVLLHALATIAAWRLFVRLHVPGALFGALLFAVHPVHVESVAWVTERKNVLSLLCALLAAHGWLSWQDTGRRRTWWLASAAFLLALFAKTVTAVLPAALLVVHWWRHGRIGKREWLAALPWLAVGALLGWFTAHLEAHYVGAAAALQLSAPERMLIAGRAPWFYLASLLWPWPLCFNYPRWQLDPGGAAQWAFVAATLAAPIAALALQRRFGRGPAAVLLLFGGTLVPVLGFLDVFPFRYSFVADHFQYHASLPMLAGLGALATLAARRFLPGRAGPAVAAAATLALALLSLRQCGDYRDEQTLWHATLRTNPDSALALANLGGLAIERGDLVTARDYCERALRHDPGSHESIANLGILAHRAKDYETAQNLYETALELKPNSAATRHNLAALHRELGHPELAVPLLQEAVELDPDFYDGHATLASVLRDLRQCEECLVHADWVLKRRPEAVETRLAAVDALLALGRFDQASGNALVLVKTQPNLEQARTAVARSLAGLLQRMPPAEVVPRATTGLTKAGLVPAAFLPQLERELRALGAVAQADAVQAALARR